MRLETDLKIEDLMSRIPALTKRQAVTWLQRTCEMQYAKAVDSIGEAAREGAVILTDTDLVTTRASYDFYREGGAEYRFGDSAPLRGFRLTAEALDWIDCFWVILDLLPESGSFLTMSFTPLRMQFVDSEGSCLTQIARIHAGNERAELAFLRMMTVPEDDRPGLRRIAIVDTAEIAPLIPRVGFREICTLTGADDRGKRQLHVVHSRPREEMWGETA